MFLLTNCGETSNVSNAKDVFDGFINLAMVWAIELCACVNSIEYDEKAKLLGHCDSLIGSKYKYYQIYKYQDVTNVLKTLEVNYPLYSKRLLDSLEQSLENQKISSSMRDSAVLFSKTLLQHFSNFLNK